MTAPAIASPRTLISLKQLQERLPVHRGTLRNFWLTGRLPRPIKLGTSMQARLFFDRDAVEEALARLGVPAASEQARRIRSGGRRAQVPLAASAES